MTGKGRSAEANTIAGNMVKLSEEKPPLDKTDFSEKGKQKALTVGRAQLF